MAAKKRCKHQGFAYTLGGKTVRIICDFDGEVHDKTYCHKECETYEELKGAKTNGKLYSD